MDYGELPALARAKWICEHRDQRASELSNAGTRIIGYHCCYVPVELFTAAGAVPFRILGDPGEPVSMVDGFLETSMCPHVRSCLELAVKGRYSFLDGVVIPHTCDAVQRIYGYWRHYVKPAYLHHLEVPHVLSAAALDFFRQELDDLRISLQQWTGDVITPEKLVQAIRIHNENRALVRGLYSLRKSHPPLVSGSEVLRTLVAAMSLPVTESNSLLKGVIDDAKRGLSATRPDGIRVLVSGCGLDSPGMIEIIESTGAVVVMDDLAIGTRSYWFHVSETGDPMDALARSYLEGIHCPRTVVGEKKLPHVEELELRFGYMVDYCREYDAKGAILYVLRFCDPHQFDAPDLADYLRNAGIASLLVDADYASGGEGQWKTRIEAFLETISPDMERMST